MSEMLRVFGTLLNYVLHALPHMFTAKSSYPCLVGSGLLIHPSTIDRSFEALSLGQRKNS